MTIDFGFFCFVFTVAVIAYLHQLCTGNELKLKFLFICLHRSALRLTREILTDVHCNENKHRNKLVNGVRRDETSVQSAILCGSFTRIDISIENQKVKMILLTEICDNSMHFKMIIIDSFDLLLKNKIIFSSDESCSIFNRQNSLF